MCIANEVSCLLQNHCHKDPRVIRAVRPVKENDMYAEQLDDGQVDGLTKRTFVVTATVTVKDSKQGRYSESPNAYVQNAGPCIVGISSHVVNEVCRS